MEKKKVRGRSRRRRPGYLAALQARKFLASALCMTLISGNVMGSAVAFASEPEPVKDEFRIHAADLEEAVREAVENNSPLTEETLDLLIEPEKASDEKEYEALFDIDGRLYEIYPDVTQAQDMTGMELRMFVRIPENAEAEDYQMTGREQLIFLFLNGTETKLSGRLNIDGYVSEYVAVKAFDDVFGEKEIPLTAIPGENGTVQESSPAEETEAEMDENRTDGTEAAEKPDAEDEGNLKEEEPAETESGQSDNGENEAAAGDKEENTEAADKEERPDNEENTEAPSEDDGEGNRESSPAEETDDGLEQENGAAGNTENGKGESAASDNSDAGDSSEEISSGTEGSDESTSNAETSETELPANPDADEETVSSGNTAESEANSSAAENGASANGEAGAADNGEGSVPQENGQPSAEAEPVLTVSRHTVSLVAATNASNGNASRDTSKNNSADEDEDLTGEDEMFEKTGNLPLEMHGLVSVNELLSARAAVVDAADLPTEIMLMTDNNEEITLEEGLTVLTEGKSGVTYNVGDGAVLAIANNSDEAIVFEDCVFNLSGKTIKLDGDTERKEALSKTGVVINNGETITKLFIGNKNIQFVNCQFYTDDGEKSSSAGYDACIYLGAKDGSVNFTDCTLSAEGYRGQFLGFYLEGETVFDHCEISTAGNIGGWSYAMYGGSVLKLINDTKMSATEMEPSGGNINAFYSGDNKANYDAVYITDSEIDFSDNRAGGFAINNVNIYVDNSKITVNDNLGNACNSGYWIVSNGSEIKMNGNQGGHGLSCIGVEMTDSSLEILHNGYAGMYIQSKDSTFTNSNVNIRCNGEKLLSYSAGDVWLNGHSATFTDCPSVWLGGVGRKGTVENNNCNDFIAYDLNESGLKSSTEPILENVTLGGQDSHLLLLNPSVVADYARGNTEGKAGNSNDDDLFEDVGIETATSIDTARIGELTTAQLSHHKYDWENGRVATPSDATHYGAMAYSCADVCELHTNWTDNHPYSFDCDGTYVYAPLVGLEFNANAGEDLVTNMPANQTEIIYGTAAEEPGEIPVRPDNSGYFDWKFTGWYIDPECTEKFDFTQLLGAPGVSWTIVYAGWEKVDPVPQPKPDDWDVSKSKMATNLDENYESEVTLSLPSSQEQLESDVVFVLDKSTSTDIKNQLLDMLQDLRSQAEKESAKINVGIVIFNKEAHRQCELTDLNTGYEQIEDAVLATISSGTNLHAGLLAGKAMLDEDTDVEANRKYLVAISDGITYIYNEEPTAVALQNGDKTNAFAGPDNWGTKYGSTEAPSQGWDNWLAEISAQIQTDGSTYEVPYGTNDPYIPYDDRADHAMAIDRALYNSYLTYTAAKAEGYHCYADVSETSASYPWASSFMDFLGGGQQVDFTEIKNDILYLVDAGSRVEDYMGYVENDYNFDFINDPEKLQLKVGDEILNITGISSTEYGFGDAHGSSDGTTYPYVLEYVRGDGLNEEHFVWHINVPVSNFAPVQLTYSVALTNPKEASGTYGQYDQNGSRGYDGLYTNNSATIYPVSTDGTNYEPEDFPKPTVSYTISETPVDPGKPTDPAEPTDPETPGDPETPTDPETPVAPTDPAEPSEPGGSTGGGGNSGSGGGGSSSSDRVNGTVHTTVINAGDVPLAPGQSGDSAIVTDPTATITDEEIPLAALPKTGEGRNISLLVFISGFAAALYLAVTGRKENEQ